MRKIKNQLGQSLFELVFALGVIAIILVALISLTTKSISNSTYSKNRSLAARYNQEAMEWVRGQRDASWPIFLNRVTNNLASTQTIWCINVLSFATQNACAANTYISGTKFVRQMQFNYQAGPPPIITVTSTITWIDPAGTHESKAVTQLTDWK